MSLLGYRSKEYADEKGREYYFDNAKFILIFLVVLGHMTSPFSAQMKTVKALWTVINSLHMPCMIFVSGYFAKSYIKNGAVRTGRLFTYILYYVVAQVAAILFDYFVLGDKENFRFSLVYPQPVFWFLCALCWWYLVLPYVAKLKPQYMILFAFVFALIIGYDTQSASVLSLMRAINHFPFFVLGYCFKKEWFFKFRNKLTQILAVEIILLISVLAYLNLDLISDNLITSQFSYERCGLKFLTDYHLMFLHRVIFYIAALLLCASFMLLVPRGKAFFTKFGSRTLQVYILHRFVFMVESRQKWCAPYINWKGYIIAVVLIFLLTIVLSLKIFEYPFKWLAKIKLKRFKRCE